MTPTPSRPAAITIVYDNNAFDNRLGTKWGFAALVEHQGHTLLFDTGADSPTLLGNMTVLDKDPNAIESVVLSHAHRDHTGGLSGLLATGARPTVYVHPSFPIRFKHQVTRMTTLVEVTPGQSVAARGDRASPLLTTGEIGGRIPEQSLAIKTDQGLVVVTGCAHPGIVPIVTRAKTLFGEPVHLVIGGFHLGNKSAAEVRAILAAFRELGVEKVAPCHCTGNRAIALFADEYGDEFIRAGVGRVVVVER
jgi:7,8-dihydropterin-6-yl-methyl-4-(beta-D-ribofuranosyl)aminobenzene 5'-phosphate synthase